MVLRLLINYSEQLPIKVIWPKSPTQEKIILFFCCLWCVSWTSLSFTKTPLSEHKAFCATQMIFTQNLLHLVMMVFVIDGTVAGNKSMQRQQNQTVLQGRAVEQCHIRPLTSWFCPEQAWLHSFAWVSFYCQPVII